MPLFLIADAALDFGEPTFAIAELENCPAVDGTGPEHLLREAFFRAERHQRVKKRTGLDRFTAQMMQQHPEQHHEGHRLRMAKIARGGLGAADPFQPLIHLSLEHQGSRRLAHAEDARLDADFPGARAVEFGVVERQPAFEVLMCAVELTQMMQRGAKAPFRDHLDVRVADLPRHTEQLVCQLVRHPNVARRDVVRRQPHQDRNHQAGVVDQSAQFARTTVGLPHLRDAEAAARFHRQGVRHLQLQLHLALMVSSGSECSSARPRSAS